MIDDRVICDLVDGVTGSIAVAVAHDLGVFQRLADGPRAAHELRAALGLTHDGGDALLTICVAAGLLDRVEQTLLSAADEQTGVSALQSYALTPVAAKFLVEGTPLYCGWLFELLSSDAPPFSYANLKRAVLGDAPPMQWDAERFTRMMHGHSMAAALAWPEAIDLSDARCFLDVGGGSGAHAIGATQRWPRLRAIVLDLPDVCRAASRFIEGHPSIELREADMWIDDWPAADVHFFSDVFHNWTAEQCRTLARMSFDRLPRGGRILVHETPYDDDKRGPFTVAASSLAMAAWCGGRQFSAREIAEMLSEAGFVEIETRKTFGYWSIIAGRKR